MLQTLLPCSCIRVATHDFFEISSKISGEFTHNLFFKKEQYLCKRIAGICMTIFQKKCWGQIWKSLHENGQNEKQIIIATHASDIFTECHSYVKKKCK